MIVFINGASSCGKTSLARELQSRWPSPLIYLSLDDVISQLPFKFTGFGANASEGFELVQRRKSCETVSEVRIGRHGQNVNALAAAHAASVAALGYDLVIDYVLLQPSMLEPFAAALSQRPLLFVGLICAESELTARQASREDRAPGLAQAQMSLVHFCRHLYDLELDSTHSSAQHLADRVLARLAERPTACGFSRTDAEA
jgi:chloramphenicol 3-O phosphotransferase